MIYELCARDPPFNARTHFELIQKIKIGKVAALPRVYSRELSEVITACLQVNPNARPDTAALLNLPRVKLIRKSQQSALIIQQHLVAKDQALDELRLARELIARLEEEKRVAYDDMNKKLHMEWETRAHLEINRRVDLAEKKFEEMMAQKVEEEVERRIAAMPSSQASSWSSNTSGSQDSQDPIPRSSTPPAFPVGHKSLNTVSEVDEDLASTTDFTLLSLEESPLEKRQKPLKKSSRTPFTRARTIANAEEFAPSPMDVQMADPSPVRNLASLSLSPRRNTPLEGTNLRQPALRGNNIFDKAAKSGAASTLFGAAGDFADEDDDDVDDSDASPTRPKTTAVIGDPFKMPPPRPASGIARPGLSRARTTVGPQAAHQRMKSTPNVFGPTAAVAARPSPSVSTENIRPSSPNRKPLAKGFVSPVRKAPSAPSQPSPTAISARKGKDDLVKAMHRNKLQGRTLVELNMAELQNQQSAGSGTDSDSDKPAGKPATKMLEPLWDPERDEMPSPFLVKSRKIIASR